MRQRTPGSTRRAPTVADADLLFRPARLPDAVAIAALHTESCRRHYRGASSDAYLAGEASRDRMAIWPARLPADVDRACALLAEQRGVVVGFALTILDEDPTWGAFLGSLHVTRDQMRRGIGA